ncbi:CDP-glycerol glycerophosphotransferase family protein [Vibrio fluvialis]|nr:CDP-glycerol glycerophosphotransferase family protein [Vibrio fluvialis]
MAFIKKLAFIFVCFCFIPLWHLQRLIKRNKNVWVFGAWFGNRYSDNCRTLFEYTQKNHNDITCIWICRDNNVEREVRDRGYTAVNRWSFKGIYYSLIAGVAIYSSGMKDINQYFINGAVVYNLWHGAPLKKIGESNKKTKSISNSFLYNYIFPFLNGLNFNYILSTSSFFNEYLKDAFNKSDHNVITAGYPRNDVLKEKLGQKSKKLDYYDQVILYMPTFRDSRPEFDFFAGFDFKQFNDVLKNRNTLFVYKLHYMSPEVNIEKSNIVNYSKLEVEGDLYDFLNIVDYLITDYSSVYFDYLLTEGKIILTPFDIESYIAMDREFYFDYDTLFCDLMAREWNDVLHYFKSNDYQISLDDERKRAKHKYNLICNNKSTQALVNEIRKNECNS